MRKQDSNAIEQLLRKYMEGTFTKQEFEKFRDFLKQPDTLKIINQLHKEDEQLGEDAQDLEGETKDARKLFEKIKERVDQYDSNNLVELFKEHKKKSKKRQFPWLKAAAVLLVVGVFAGGLWYYKIDTPGEITWLEKHTQKGQKSTITLMDGSTVVLNAQSKLSFPEQFSATREVILEGEAFFMVSRDEDRPFMIKSGNLVTKVLGTSFNIQAYPGSDIHVTVATGKVAVARSSILTTASDLTSKPFEAEALLTPNEQVTYNITTDQIAKQQVDAERICAWREGVLTFTSVKFQEVVTTLKRWYGVEIILENENLGNCVVSFEAKNESLENLLKALQFIIDIQYEFTKEEVLLRGDGCM